MVVVGFEHLVPRSGTQLLEWNIIMAAAVLALLPWCWSSSPYSAGLCRGSSTQKSEAPHRALTFL
jgi:hypothetical protein